MQLKEMQYIYTIYQERSFSKAAKKLFVSQPALSAVVKKAEKEIGEQIFDRSTLPFSVTGAGEYYISQVRQILQLNDNMMKYFQDSSDLKTGYLSVGSSSFFCAYVLSSQVGAFRQRYPGIHIDLHEMNVEILKNKVENDELDIILETSFFDEDNLEKYLFAQEDILLAVPKDYEINAKLHDAQMTFQDVREKKYKNSSVPSLSLSVFRDEPFLFLREGNDLYTRGMKMCEEAGFEPQIKIFLDQILTAFNIASTGAGVAFIRSSIPRFVPETGRLVYYKIDSPLAKRPIYYAYKKGAYLTYPMRAFLQMNGIRPGR